ncbi:hypothetical protein IJI79_02195 [Candidatus Saccharibacteria bacterium]|nr:hypothetical protein [Candidatus Saccharibacteria bacterium]
MSTEAQPLNKKQIREVLAEGKINHHGRGRTAAEKQRDYAEYYERKKIVFEAEDRNEEYLVLFLASDGNNPNKEKKFYNMGGNSALIYAYDIGPMIGRNNVIIKPDLDNGYYKFKRGMVSVADLALLTEKLKQVGIERVPRDNDDLIVYFKLKRKYSKDDIKGLIAMHRDEVKEVNKILYTNVVFPDIHKQTMDLRTTVYHKLLKIARTDREILQDKILGPVFAITDTYALMAHGDMDVREAGEKMVVNIDILMDRMSMIMDLQLLEISSMARMGKIAAGLRNLVVGKMVNYRAPSGDNKSGAIEDSGEAKKSETGGK